MFSDKLYINKYYKYKTKYLYLKQNMIGGAARDKRLENEFKKMEDDSIFLSKLVPPYKEATYVYIYDNKLKITIPEGYPFKFPIVTEISTGKSLNLKSLWSPASSIKVIITDFDTLPKKSEKSEDLNLDEFVKWKLFKTVHNLIAKSFTQTLDFYNRNKCKILISFDNTKVNSDLIKLFIKYNETDRQFIIRYLFDNNTKIHYYICDNFSNIFFYDIDRLTILLNLLKKKENNLYSDDFSIDNLLELVCKWVEDKNSFEFLLIHILFGSTITCQWASQDIDILSDIVIKADDTENIKTLKEVYKDFVQDVEKI